ncbi:hypothetical protein K2X85_08495 [bacterium]|nr:hypothetical protein [bacterium]
MRTWKTLGLAAVTVVGFIVGCSNEAKPTTTKEKPATTPATDEHADEHAHPSHGPHGGDLIELGDEEYHAEFVHDEKTSDVTIYFLDAAVKNAVAIDATEIVINLKHDGKPEQHKLAAEPQEGDSPGKSSRFVSKKNDDLCHAIEEEGANAKLQVTIDGKPFTGAIQHEHDHEGHDHDHEHKEHVGHDDEKK